MPKLANTDPAPPPRDIPELRAACKAEAEAVERIHDMKRRLQAAEADIVLRQRDREALASRAAVGEEITGADLRAAAAAIEDAAATANLLREALPKAAVEARRASLERQRGEAKVTAEYRQPFLADLEAAEHGLKEAQQRHAEAKQAADRLPQAVQADLDALLDRHGLEPSAARYIEQMDRVEETNRTRAQMNVSTMPQLPWPP